MQGIRDEICSAWVASSASGGESLQYICDCGLNAVVRTSFTYQNMGKRFRGCPKLVKPYNYFHFLPGEETIEGRPRELLLILKDREQKLKRENENLKNENEKLVVENQNLKNENVRLKNENVRLKNENENLKNENDTLKNDNGYLTNQCELWIKKMKTAEKKVKRLDRDYRTSNKLNHIMCVFFGVFMAVLLVILLGRSMW